MRAVLVVLLFLLGTGCATATKVSYRVTSQPPQAPIDVNGVNMGETPTEITIQCSKKWVGLMNSPDGWANSSGKYEVKAYPPKGFAGQAQSKQVDPCQWQGGENPNITFDLNLESVSPKQKIEIITNDPKVKGDIERAIEALKTLRDQGLISEEEYKAKVLQLVR